MKATVDRIDDGVAVLITQEDRPVRITMPASLLPAGSREGDVVTLDIGRDPEASSLAKKDMAGLIDRLRSRH